MKHKITLSLLPVLSFGLILVSGCNKGNPTPSGGPLPAVAETPEAAVQQFASAMKDGRPDVLFNMLPNSYQGEIGGLVKQFATNMDEEIWKDGMGIAKRVAAIMKDKKDLILSPELLGGDMLPESAKGMVDSWDDVSGIFNSVVNSDFTDLNKLKSGDLKNMIGKSGAEIMKSVMSVAKKSGGDEYNQMMSMVDSLKTEVLSSENGVASLNLTFNDGDGPTTQKVELSQVEGAWIPKDLAEQWPNMIKEAKAGLAQMDSKAEGWAQKKAGALMGMGMVKGVLGTIESATTPEDLKKAVGGIMGMFGGGLGEGPGGGF